MNRDVAVIGIAGRFPGANDVESFFENLKAGKDCVVPLSDDRKLKTNLPLYKPYRIGGYLQSIDSFDYQFFNLSLGEAEHMDPRQRMVLESVYHAVENAAYNIDQLAGSRTSVYVGDTSLDYYKHAKQFEPTLVTGNTNAALAGRIARSFDFRGTAAMVDTSCSSSLVALHLACNDLIFQEADYAVVCGVNLYLFPASENNEHQQIGILSSSGKTKAFSEGSDGTAIGEAVVTVLLKPLQKAVADQDIVYAVIKGTAVNQDARLSASLTSPSSEAQAEVIKMAWQKANIDPSTVSYIECHGTGTKLGDPIELDGIQSAFSAFTNKKQFCAVSSVKSNLGHTISAAGLVSFVKAVLSLKHRLLFPSLHFEEPNVFFDFVNSPVYVNNRLAPWESETLRRAGVSSFGIMGTNCHVVLEEYVTQDESTGPLANPALILLSAKTNESLHANIEKLREHLLTDHAASLKDLNYTLLSGRKHYERRVAFFANDRNDLIERLSRIDVDKDAVDVTPFKGKIVFLFPDFFDIDDVVINIFRDQFTEFKLVYDRCAALAGEASGLRNQQLRVFLFEYAFYSTLEKSGFKSKFLLGNGLGKIVAAAVSGQKSFSQCIEDLVDYNRKETGNLGEKLTNFIKSQTEPIIFLELGISAELSTSIRNLDIPGGQYKVVTVQRSENMMQRLLLQLTQLNHHVDFSQLFQKNGGRRIALPAYEFLKRRCWFSESRMDEEHAGSLLYEQQWVPDNRKYSHEAIRNKNIVLFADEAGLANEIESILKANDNACIIVRNGMGYSVDTNHRYTIDFENEAHYVALQHDLKKKFAVHGVIHLSGYSSAGDQGLEKMLQTRFFSLVLAAKVFSGFFSQDFVFASVSAMQKNGDPVLNGVHGMNAAFMKSMLADHPMMTIAHIGAAFSESALPALAARVMDEITSDAAVKFATYDQGQRLVNDLRPVGISKRLPAEECFRDGGVYLITGGLGGVGFEIAKYIALTYKACHLIIVGREDVRSHNDHGSLPEKGQRLAALRGSAARVDYYAMDLGQPSEIETLAVVLQKEKIRLAGVFHCAGIKGVKTPVGDKELADLRETLRTKVDGFVFLEKSLRPFSPRFLVVCSSIGAFFPRKHDADYTCANAFVDAFADSYPVTHTRLIAVNWSVWQDIGMSRVKDAISNEMTGARAIQPRDAINALVYGTRLHKNRIVIADVDLNLFSTSPFFVVGKSEGEYPEERINTGAIRQVEEAILSIWREVLKKEDIGLEDNYFQLGGHSLNGAQVINRIQRRLNVKLPFKKIYEFPTVSLLSAYIVEQVRAHAVTEAEISPTPLQANYEVSHAQRRLWILHQLERGLIAYNIPYAFVFKGSFRKDIFIRALQAMVQRHESLRTTFTTVSDEPRQVIADELLLSVDVVDLVNDQHVESTIRTLSDAEVETPFDLQHGPLVRAKLLQVTEEKHILLLTVNHIIFDYISMRVFIREIVTLYRAFKDGLPDPLEPLRIQYKDFAHWSNTAVVDARLKKAEAYWKAHLGGNLPLLRLPTDKPRPSIKTYVGRSYAFVLDGDRAKLLNELAVKFNTSLFIILETYLTILFHSLTGQDDIIIGTVTAGRNHLELENQIGFFLNTVVLRNNVSKDDTLESLIRKVRSTTMEAFEHDDYPFDKLLSLLDIKVDPSTSPVFNTMLIFKNQVKVEVDLDFEVSEMEVERKTSSYDLLVNVAEETERFRVEIDYNTDLFDRSTIQFFVWRLFEILDSSKELSQSIESIVPRERASEKGANKFFKAEINF